MRPVKIRQYIFKLGWVVVMAVMLLPANAGLAQDGRSKRVLLPEYYPDKFSGFGCVDFIEAKTVVIGDSSYRLAPDVSLHGLDTFYASRSDFNENAFVGYVISGKNTIGSLWYIKRCR